MTSPGAPKDARIVRLVRPAMLDGKAITKDPDITVDIRVSTKQQLPPGETPAPARFKRAPGEPVNWHGMQPLHRANILSLKELGLMFDCAPSAIVKHANKHGWERDPEGRAHARADDKVRETLVQQAREAEAAKLAKAQARANSKDTLSPPLDIPPDPSNPEDNTVNSGEREVNETALVNDEGPKRPDNRDMSQPVGNAIEAYAEVITRVRLGQNERFRRVAQLCMSMFEELEEQVEARPLLNELGDLMVRPNDAGYDKLNEIYRKVIEFPGQVRAMKDLADVIGQLTTWETKAFRLDTAPLGGNTSKKHLLVRFVDAPPMVERVDEDKD